MNANNSNTGGLTLLLVVIMVSAMSSMSASSAYLAYDLMSSVAKPSPELAAYDQEIKEKTDQKAAELGLSSDEIRKEIRSEYRKACLIDVIDGKCPEGTKPGQNGCCDFDDPKMKSKFEKALDITADIIEVLVVNIMAEALVTAVYKKVMSKRALSMASRTAGRVGSRVATRVGTRVAMRASMSAAKFGAMKCGPPCIALIAFEVLSLALDLTDPFGYNNFQANEVIRNERNYIDVQVQKQSVEAYPLTFPLTAAFPEYDKEFTTKLTGEMLADALKLLDKNLLVELLTTTLSEDKKNQKVSENLEKALDAAMDKAMANTTRRDKIIYDFFVSKGKGKHIERVDFMATKDRFGVTLSEYGAKEYNDRMRSKHLDYANPFKAAPGPIPDDYSPFVAVYTDTYRVINPSNPGTEAKPNVIEKKLPRKICLGLPYGGLIAHCEYGMKSSKHSQRLNPSVYGVRYNYERGDCDFTDEYCTRLGLEFKNNDCKMAPGQKYIEMILGTTITRTYKTDWDQRVRAFKSKDPGKITLAIVTLPFMHFTPWIGKLVSAIKDTYGRGVGTVPTRCGPDKEKKGALCYPKCRDGYKSSALECEGTCPPGSRNTGLTCIQGIHAYIPGNKCSNPFKKCFYQRKPCRAGFRYRGSTCNAECLPGFTFRSGAAGSAFCDKPRNRYSRASKSAPLDCPEGKVKDAGLCYKPCKEGYTGNGPTCKKVEESKHVNIYDV